MLAKQKCTFVRNYTNVVLFCLTVKCIMQPKHTQQQAVADKWKIEIE